LPEIRALRPEIQQHLPLFDLVSFNKLEDYVFALAHAQAEYATATKPVGDLDVVGEEATKLRETLLLEATVLAHRGHIDGNRLKELKGANGYKNVAADLWALANLLRQNWSKLQGLV
jgi:hypothetical protein